MADLTTTGTNSQIKPVSRFPEWVREFAQTLFQTLLITYLLLILLETISSRSVSSYINLNYLLIIITVVGVVAVLMEPIRLESITREHLNRKSIFLILCAGIAGTVIIWYKTQEIGWLAFVISLLGGFLVVLLSVEDLGKRRRKSE